MEYAAGSPRRTRPATAPARRSSNPARPAARAAGRTPRQGQRRGVDARWLLAGATAAVAAVAVAAALLFGGSGIGGGRAATPPATAAAPVGQVTGAAAVAAAPAMLPVGATAPDLQWTLNGEAGSLAAERGRPVLLVFGATWCPHCQAEVAVLNRVQERFAGQGLAVLGVSASPIGMDGRGPASLGDLERFVKTYGARYPHLYDAGLLGAQRYGVRGFPTLYLVDGEGVVRYAASGEVPEAELARAVQGVLAPAA